MGILPKRTITNRQAKELLTTATNLENVYNEQYCNR